MSLLKVIHAIFEIFWFLYEQWSQIEVEFEKVSTILDSLKFGTADSPRVRGGQSAVHETCPPEALQRSSQPQKYTADSPPKDRGRSANGQKGGSWLIISYKEKWQILDWSWVTSIERSSSWNHLYKWLRNLGLVLRGARSITSIRYKAIWLWCVLGTYLALNWKIKTKLKKKEKDLKKDVKIFHHDKSIVWSIN